MARSDNFYDEWGQTYEVRTYGVSRRGGERLREREDVPVSGKRCAGVGEEDDVVLTGIFWN